MKNKLILLSFFIWFKTILSNEPFEFHNLTTGKIYISFYHKDRKFTLSVNPKDKITVPESFIYNKRYGTYSILLHVNEVERKVLLSDSCKKLTIKNYGRYSIRIIDVNKRMIIILDY